MTHVGRRGTGWFGGPAEFWRRQRGRNKVEKEPVEMRTFEEQVGVGEGMEVRLQRVREVGRVRKMSAGPARCLG